MVWRIKAGVHLNAISPPLHTALMELSRSRFKQSENSLLISLIYVMGCFHKFWVCLGENLFFSKNFIEITNIEDLIKF